MNTSKLSLEVIDKVSKGIIKRLSESYFGAFTLDEMVSFETSGMSISVPPEIVSNIKRTVKSRLGIREGLVET
jgi:hypothetical protein